MASETFSLHTLSDVKSLLQCDERQPICSACERRNDTCSLQFLSSNGQLPKSDGFKPLLPAPVPNTLLDVTEVAVIQHGFTERGSSISSGGFSPITFDVSDLVTFRHFEKFTSASIGDEKIQSAYRGQVLEMALQHPYLMHAVLAMSQLHEHYQKGRTSHATSDPRFIRNWQKCLTQFSAHLAPRIQGDTADSMMVTSTIINGIAFCMLGDHRSESQWPLTVSGENDLYWLNVQKGISLVFRAATPFDESSKIGYLFGPDTDVEYFEQPEITVKDLLLLTPELAELCEITAATSTANGNAYYETLKTLVPLLQMPCDADTIFVHLGFLPAMEARFISLLRKRDHRALLILCYWYANISTYDCWWTNIRSKTEGTAICRYLVQHADSRILLLLRVPAKVFDVPMLRQRSSNLDSWQDDAQTLTPCRMM